MGTTASTIVVFTTDKVNFPIKVAMVVMKQLFQYGVKDMRSKGDKIFISLSYSPKTVTLKRKFGNLPVRYMRAKIDEELEDLPRRRIETSKRKLYLEEPTLQPVSSNEEDEIDSPVSPPPPIRNQKRRNPDCGSASTSSLLVIDDRNSGVGGAESLDPLTQCGQSFY